MVPATLCVLVGVTNDQTTLSRSQYSRNFDNVHLCPSLIHHLRLVDDPRNRNSELSPKLERSSYASLLSGIIRLDLPLSDRLIAEGYTLAHPIAVVGQD